MAGNQHIKALIIEDDSFSSEQLKDLLVKYHKNIELLQVCLTAKGAEKAILKHKPHLVFLDIELPDMNGFELLKKLPEVSFEIIFTTAFDHYALQAIRFSALDYLLKPIDKEQLNQTIDKAAARINEKRFSAQLQRLFSQVEERGKPLENLGVPTLEGLLFIRIADIVHCESYDKYTRIYCGDKKMILSSRTLGEFEDLLTSSGFIRVHKSHLINKSHISRYIKGEGGQIELTNGAFVDVSRRSKANLLNIIAHFK
jgi:two-component system LytT family response regulator